jgi:hypothetical protein
MKLGMYKMAAESKQSVPVSVSPLSLLGNGSVNTFPRQRIHETIEELLDASFSVRSVSHKKKVGD